MVPEMPLYFHIILLVLVMILAGALWVRCSAIWEFRFNHTKKAGWRKQSQPFSWFTMVHYGPLWFTMVHYGSLWFTMVHYGSLWFTMVHYGSLWFTMVHYGRLHVVHRLLEPPDFSWCCHSPDAVVLLHRPSGSALWCSGVTKRDGGAGDATPGLLLVQLQLGWMILPSETST